MRPSAGFRCWCYALILALSPWAGQAADEGWLPATAEKLPRWRGFNLQNKFVLGTSRPFAESDFRMIHEMGFNFVRLPMDYRIWIVNGDWTRINPDALKDIDQAVAWGEKYHLHVCLNFHRAPGYTVAQPPEPRSLWTDEEAQRVCALHWATFARRYKGIPNDRLSFDLFNEPPDLDPAVYAKVVGRMVAAIRQEDRDRLIIADGRAWGNVPCPELAPLHIAQATRGYAPLQVSHYLASWIGGSSDWAVPTWPLAQPVSSFLYGPDKSEFQSSLTLTGPFPAGTRIELVVGTVSMRGRLVVRADNRPIFDQTFVSGSVSKSGEKVVYLSEYKVYQNVFDRPYVLVLPRAASRITLEDSDGDWMTLKSLAIRPAPEGMSYPLSLDDSWGTKDPVMTFTAAGAGQPAWSGNGGPIDRAWLWQHQMAPWRGLETQGVGVMVGEWGCYDQTPYEVTLHWMEDNLANFKQAGWGWALWNFSGEFGLLDSNRPGAVYENYEGHKLDRRMLGLLERY
jgi:aryl-phospho-beta-D-glucosidase BglC (GH1 family)